MSSLPTPSNSEFLTAAELMQRWHVNRSTLWRWTRNGVPGVPAIPLASMRLGRRVLFTRAAVEEIEAFQLAASSPASRRTGLRRKRRGNEQFA